MPQNSFEFIQDLLEFEYTTQISHVLLSLKFHALPDVPEPIPKNAMSGFPMVILPQNGPAEADYQKNLIAKRPNGASSRFILLLFPS